LFYTGAAHSFITNSLAVKTGQPIEPISTSFRVKTPIGSVVTTREIVRNCPLEVQKQATVADLIVLEMSKYDVILSISWLVRTKVVVDCGKKIISFLDQDARKVEFVGDFTIIRESELCSFALIEEDELGIDGYVGNTKDDKEKPSLADIPIVNEFSNVF